jgi:hypothetical protein
MFTKFLQENLKGIDHLEYLSVDEGMIIKCILIPKYAQKDGDREIVRGEEFERIIPGRRY